MSMQPSLINDGVNGEFISLQSSLLYYRGAASAIRSPQLHLHDTLKHKHTLVQPPPCSHQSRNSLLTSIPKHQQLCVATTHCHCSAAATSKTTHVPIQCCQQCQSQRSHNVPITSTYVQALHNKLGNPHTTDTQKRHSHGTWTATALLTPCINATKPAQQASRPPVVPILLAVLVTASTFIPAALQAVFSSPGQPCLPCLWVAAA